jgi:transposase-like protein
LENDVAYSADQKKQARERYIFKRQSPPSIALALGVPATTIRRWKREALKRSDDWDMARTSHLVGGQGLDAVVAATVEDFVMLAQATIEDIKNAGDDGHDTKVKQLVALADATSKMVAAAGRLSPKISELGIAQDVLARLSAFVSGKYPQHADAFLEILEPFGAEISNVYS